MLERLEQDIDAKYSIASNFDPFRMSEEEYFEVKRDAKRFQNRLKDVFSKIEIVNIGVGYYKYLEAGITYHTHDYSKAKNAIDTAVK